MKTSKFTDSQITSILKQAESSTWVVPYYSRLCRRQKHVDIAIGYQKKW
ncbi:transposase [Acinetobacter venetianus]|nr:transposase [Acinetobacter venetianus]MCR4532678.1 transposase [Acinetobacter venetianus]